MYVPIPTGKLIRIPTFYVQYAYMTSITSNLHLHARKIHLQLQLQCARLPTGTPYALHLSDVNLIEESHEEHAALHHAVHLHAVLALRELTSTMSTFDKGFLCIG